MNRSKRQTRFIALDPRKKKHILFDKVLSPLGNIKWIAFPHISFSNWPETRVRVDEALASAKKQPITFLDRSAKKLLLTLQYNWSRKFFQKYPNTIAVCWNGLNGTRRVFMEGAKDAGARRLFFELAPLPRRFTVDPCGVNFANSLPREITPYLHWYSSISNKSRDWRDIKKYITQRPSIRNLTYQNTDKYALTDPFFFAPLQVPGDSQLHLFGGNFSIIKKFIRCLCNSAIGLPKGWHLRIKEHPSAPKSIAESLVHGTNAPVIVDNITDTFEQVASSRGVVTVNSSVGLEAMFFDKPVIVTGQSFWAIEGIAVSARTPEELAMYFRNPDIITFKNDARDAFLSYLTQCYYPHIPDSFSLKISEMIEERLHGPDIYGFWNCH